jgi:hypothetical protein
MRVIAALTTLMILTAPAYPQNLEQQEQMNKVLGAIDQLGSTIDKIAKERRLQCIAAIANEPFCECLGRNLPVAINFVNYVALVTQTKEELKYNTLSAEDKQIVDNTRAARDECVKGRAVNCGALDETLTRPANRTCCMRQGWSRAFHRRSR